MKLIAAMISSIVIGGCLSGRRINGWYPVADNPESRTGKRIGFVFNDSVIMEPTVNCRI